MQIEEIGVPFGSNYTRDDSWLNTDDIRALVKTGHQILKNDIKPAIFPASLPLAHFSLVMLAISAFGQTEANYDWTFQPNINNWLWKLSSENFCICTLQQIQTPQTELLDSPHLHKQVFQLPAVSQ